MRLTGKACLKCDFNNGSIGASESQAGVADPKLADVFPDRYPGPSTELTAQVHWMDFGFCGQLPDCGASLKVIVQALGYAAQPIQALRGVRSDQTFHLTDCFKQEALNY